MNRAIAPTLAALTLALVMVDLALFEFFGPFIIIPVALLPLGLVGALLVTRLPRNPVGWLLVTSGLCFELAFGAGAYAWAALVRDQSGLPGGALAAVISNATFSPGLGLAVLMLLFFPSGRGLGGRWTWVERALIAVVVVITGTDLLKDVPVTVASPLAQFGGTPMLVDNPLAVRGPLAGIVAAAAVVGSSPTIPIILLGPLSLVVRYQRSTRVEREQIKWLAYSGSVSLTLIVFSNLVPGESSNWLWGAGLVTLGTLPIAIAIAIFRYRLYDIDVLIRRTLIYAGVLAVLAVAYLGAIALTQTLLAPFTAGNSVAVAVSTLAVVALFQPVLRRIRSTVDRRFYRAKFDAERTLDAFAVRLRDEVDLRALEHELLTVIDETLQPSRASVWLR